MTNTLPPRAPAVREKLGRAEEVLAQLEADVAALALDASEGVAGAEKALAAHRSRIEMAERQESEMRRAVALAERLDRQANAAAGAAMRAAQMSEFTATFDEREKEMGAVLAAAAAMAKAYGRFSEATLRAAAVVPSGTSVPVMAIGPQGVYGPAFGPAGNLILAEFYRLAPERKDGVGRFLLPFCKPMSELTRLQPQAIPAGIDEFTAADKAILADIAIQIERLNGRDLDAATEGFAA